MGRRLTQSDVIKRFLDIHGDEYDYSLVNYINARTPIDIICRYHGVFTQNPHCHYRGQGCPKCNGVSYHKLISQFEAAHGKKYDYSLVEYVGSNTKIKIICKDHGVFNQSPDCHKRGRGCPACANISRGKSSKGGYDTLTSAQRRKIKDVYLYHVELVYQDSMFHKIGITGDLRTRLSGIQRDSKSTLVNGWSRLYKNAESAYSREQKLLDYMMFDRSEKWYHPIEFDGKTECFLPVPNPQGWNLDLSNIPQKSPQFNYNDAFE